MSRYREPIKNGLIGKWQPTGIVELGDACQRVFTKMWLTYLHNPYNKYSCTDIRRYMDELYKNGKHRRSNDDDWTGDFDRGSRDQKIPLICCLGIKGMEKELIIDFLWHILRLGFFTNTRRNHATKKNHKTLKQGSKTEYFNYNRKLPDISGPSFYGAYIRSFNLWLLWPFLVISDLELLFNAIRYRFGDDKDVLNYLNLYLQSKYILPTPITFLCHLFNDNKILRDKIRLYFDDTESREVKDLYLSHLI